MASQTQAAAGSSMANIAEGFIRRSDKEFVQFLFIAMASTAEVQSHLYIALDQNYIDDRQFQEVYDQADKTGRMISGLIKYLRTEQTEPTRQTRPTRPTRPTRLTSSSTWCKKMISGRDTAGVVRAFPSASEGSDE